MKGLSEYAENLLKCTRSCVMKWLRPEISNNEDKYNIDNVANEHNSMLDVTRITEYLCEGGADKF